MQKQSLRVLGSGWWMEGGGGRFECGWVGGGGGGRCRELEVWVVGVRGISVEGV